MSLFKNKYRNGTCRKPGWNYGNPGYYFVTICVKPRLPVFGSIKNDQVILSDIGVQAHQCWQDIPKHFPNAQIDAYIIMPDHVHGIIIINPRRYVGPQVGLRHHHWYTKQQNGANIFGPQSRNLASIIRGFKIGVTQYAHAHNINDFSWQRLYYDHIIRNERSLQRIRHYIISNPKHPSCNH